MNPESKIFPSFDETVAEQNRRGVVYTEPTVDAVTFRNLSLRTRGFDAKAVEDWGAVKDRWSLDRVKLMAKSAGSGAIWILVGSQGAGKSTTGTLAARWVLHAGKDVLCVRWPILVRKIMSTFGRASNVTAEDVLAGPFEVPWLMIEDLQGTQAKAYENDILVAMVRRRADNKRDTVFCSESSVADVEKIIGSAIVARANKVGGFIQFTGPSKRV